MSYVVIVVLCLAIVTVSVTLLLQGYRDQLAMERLDNVARPVAAQLRSLIQGEVSSSELLSNMAEQAQSNDIYIILGGSDGNIVRQIPPEPGPQQQLLELPAGELPHNIRKATQGTFTTLGGRTFIYAAYPFGRVSGPGEQTRIQTLIIAAPRSGTFAIWASLLRPLLLAGLIALAISLIVAILLARSLHRPIKQMTDVVMEMSEDRYDVQIPIAGSKEMKRLAQGLNQMANQIKRSQLQLRHFVADASHQLKSPLTSIQGFAQAMLDGTASDDEARLRAAQIINDESKRMRKQVEELLELARMQAGQLKMEHEPIELNELLEHCLEIYAPQIEEKAILLKMKTEPSINIRGDFDQLEQAVNNLLDNAIKNSPAKGVMRIEGRKADKESVELLIADNGPGISPDQIPYIFERFYQVGGVRSGFGLGLAIAKEIVLSHGGTIEARSQPGEGTEFIITLPSTTPAVKD
jgi:signal transduction histidine kinase